MMRIQRLVLWGNFFAFGISAVAFYGHMGAQSEVVDMLALSQSLDAVQQAAAKVTTQPASNDLFLPKLSEWFRKNYQLSSGKAVSFTTLSSAEFAAQLQKVINISASTLKGDMPDWVSKCNATCENKTFLHCIARVVPGGSKVYSWGDLHGDIASLVKSLWVLRQDKVLNDDYKITSPHTYLIFCGDWVDRGEHGIPVVATLLQLKLANPEHVILVRGNHEDVEINEAYMKANDKSFFHTIKLDMHRFYNSLPVVAFIGVADSKTTNFMQYCHGGLELYDVTQLLQNAANASSGFAFEAIKKIDRLGFIYDQFMKKGPVPYLGIDELSFENLLLPNEKLESSSLSLSDRMTYQGGTYPFIREEIESREKNKATNIGTTFTAGDCGFMWFDFKALPGSQRGLSVYEPRRGIRMGFALASHILENPEQASGSEVAIIGVIRAHQHNPSMGADDKTLLFDPKNNGVFRLASRFPPIFTSCGMSLYGCIPTFLALSFTLADPSSWKLQSYNVRSVTQTTTELKPSHADYLQKWTSVGGD